MTHWGWTDTDDDYTYSDDCYSVDPDSDSSLSDFEEQYAWHEEEIPREESVPTASSQASDVVPGLCTTSVHKR